jgi:hypothetical protein
MPLRRWCGVPVEVTEPIDQAVEPPRFSGSSPAARRGARLPRLDGGGQARRRRRRPRRRRSARVAALIPACIARRDDGAPLSSPAGCGARRRPACRPAAPRPARPSAARARAACSTALISALSLVDDRRRHAAWRRDRVPGHRRIAGTPASAIVGTSGRLGLRVVLVTPGPHLAGLDVLVRGADAFEQQLHLAAQQVGHRRGAAAVGHVHVVDLRHVLEQLGRHVHRRAVAGRAVAQRGPACCAPGQQLLDVLDAGTPGSPAARSGFPPAGSPAAARSAGRSAGSCTA